MRIRNAFLLGTLIGAMIFPALGAASSRGAVATVDRSSGRVGALPRVTSRESIAAG
jgi:hypothetical protein